MKKLLLSALMVLGALTNAFANEILLGDAKDDPFVYPGEGLGYSEDAKMGVALRITARQLQAYPGAKITGLKIAAGDGVQELQIDAFLSKGTVSNGELTLGETVASTKEYIGWEPNPDYKGTGLWSNVLFDQPYVIPSQASDIRFDLYFGFYMSVKANANAIGVSAYKQQVDKNKVYLAIGSATDEENPSNWADITSIPSIYNSNVAVCAIVELPEENNTNALSIHTAYAPTFGILNHPVTAYIYLANAGPTEIKNFEVTTTLDDDAETTQIFNFPEDEPMPVGYVAQNRQAMPIQLNVLGSGVHKMTITKVNDEENLADPETTTVEFNIIGIPEEEAAKHTRRPVVEQFCAEDDHKSGVYQDDIVLPSLEPYQRYCTFLPQHSNDKFGQNPQDIPAFIDGKETTLTLTDADRLFIGLVGDINKVMIPTQTIDRSIQMQEIVLAGKTESTVTATLYPMAMIYYMNEALSIPTFASVELTNTYNPETSMLQIEANGSVADVLPAGEQAHLALYIIEESVTSDSQEFPDDESIPTKYPDGIFTHARVVRQMATSIEGDPLEAGEFSKTYTVEIENPRWNADHMKVVALIQRPMTNDILYRNIINSSEAPITDTYEEFIFSSIQDIEASATDTQSGIYDLQGRRLNAPIRGINIINGKKILVK